MFYFQNPLADFVVALNDFDFIAQLWAQWSPNYVAGENLTHVRRALANEENLRAALGYYRAIFESGPPDESHAHVQAAMLRAPTVPTLYLHGRDDGCILVAHHDDVVGALAPGSQICVIAHAGHFLHLEQPAAVHEAVDSFLDG